MSIVYKNTDQLWEAVLLKLPNEIREKVSVPDGKPYFFIKPKSKHLGVKDFKYCVVYSSRRFEACVNVESLNGGESAKTKIQKFIDCHDAGHILDGVVAQQGAKNKNKWSWAVTTSANELNEELVQWYVETITAFYEFFETHLNGVVEEQEDNSNVELADIAKDSFIFISYTTNDEEYYFCFLQHRFKDGAAYLVEQEYGDFELPSEEPEYIDCWSENIEEEYEDVESMAEQLVKDYAENLYDECAPDTDGTMALDDEYTLTIFTNGNKVFEQTFCSPVEPDDDWDMFGDNE